MSNQMTYTGTGVRIKSYKKSLRYFSYMEPNK